MPESKSGALDQLGDAPSENRSLKESRIVQRVLLQPAHGETLHRSRQLREQHLRIFLPPELGEHAAARPRHSGRTGSALTAFAQPLEMLRDDGISARSAGLEIIAALPRQKGRYFERFRIPCQ